jgi:hypothetical protein
MTYMAIDQYGETYHNLGPRPRKALLDRLGRKHAARMYVNTKTRETVHIGWIIAGRWLTVYRVERMEG